MKTFTVPRSQGTYADTLLALGLGRLLKVLDPEAEVLLRAAPQADALSVSTDHLPELPVGTPPQLYEYIKTEKDDSGQLENFDYVREKQRRQLSFEWKKANPKAKWEDIPDDIGQPRSDYSLYSSLVDMLKPLNTSGYATAHRELSSDRFSAHSRFALDALAEAGSLELAEAALSQQLKSQKDATKVVSVVQIFNPMTGKGMNAPKPNSIGMGQEKAPLMLEALKYTGWFVGAVAVYPTDSKDLKVLVVQPTEIELEKLESVMAEFRKSLTGGGAIQVDILAALTLTETLLKHDEHKTFRRGRPRDIVQGFQTAYFQNLGSAKGVTNISFIALPAWVKLENEDAAETRGSWLSILQEHRQMIRRLDESRSEERSLLEQYRDFLSGQDVWAFLEFLSDYGPHALRLADRDKPNQRPVWMTTDSLGRVLENMEHAERNNIKSIISNAGFQSVAGAIRRATRSALYAKKNNDRTYDIHYGLAQELKRSAVTKAKFMAALSDFVAEYMNENLQAADRGKRGRAAVTTEDLLSVGTLLDNNDPQMVAMLLIAYGYAKEPKDEPGEIDPQPAVDADNDTQLEDSQ